MTSRSRGYCFTLNNYKKKDIKSIKQIECKYLIFGKEVGAQGTPHLQGYIYFENAKSFSKVKKLIPRANIREAKGNAQQNRTYCSKDGDFYEAGDMPQQGKRKDLDDIAERIANGETVASLTIERPMWYHQYGRTMNYLEGLRLQNIKRTKMTKGYWLYGPSGVGKSHRVITKYAPEDLYIHPVNDRNWWDGYNMQPIVLINDFRGGIAYNELLQLVDKWPHRVSRRNHAPMPFMAKKLYITSPDHPDNTYHNLSAADSLDQLHRRFKIKYISQRED